MTTSFDFLATAIRARSVAPGGLAPPVASLWPDRCRECAGVIPICHSHTCEVLALGDFRLKDRRGPAVRLCCVVDHAINFSDFTLAQLRIFASSTCRA